MSEHLMYKTARGHWWQQRLTALALLPLSIWLLILLNKALSLPYAQTIDWLATPINAVAIALWLIIVSYHGALGIQVVLEDYVSDLAVRKLAIRASNLAFLSIGVASLIALLILIF